MLLGFNNHLDYESSARDSIHNYYEQMVIDQLIRSSDRATRDPDFLADVTCVALNRLPPRYIRYDVDMTFFLSPMEMDEMDEKVAKAVNAAVAYVEKREKLKSAEEHFNTVELTSRTQTTNTSGKHAEKKKKSD